MAAVVEVHYFSGAGATPVDRTGQNVRHKRADNDTVDVNSPVPVPVSGTNYGWRKHSKFYVASGIGAQVGNIRWFADIAPGDWAGTVSLFAGITAGYVQGSATDETTQIGQSIDANAYTSASPLTVTASANAITVNASYGTQQYVRSQIGVLAGTPAGVKTARTLTFRYDET